MKRINAYLEGAGKLGVWGVGVEGQSTLRHLARVGLLDRVTAFDQNPEKALATLAEKGIPQVPVLPQDALAEQVGNLDLVVISPGIPIRKFPFLEGVRLENQASLFMREYHGKAIGVTGTKGKSTFVTLLHQSLLAAGQKSVLVGNIGMPPLDVADQLEDADWLVAELSSYQLDLVRHSPARSVLLNLFEDHLDYHGGREAYWSAKFNIFRHPVEPTVCYHAQGFAPIEEAIASHGISATEFRVFSTKEFAPGMPDSLREAIEAKMSLRPLHLRGMFNALWELCASWGPEPLIQAIEAFEPLKFRLQDEGIHRGIRFINDSISTVPESTLAALKAYETDCDCLLMGGMDRGINLKPVARELTAWGGHLVLLPDSGTRLLQEIEALGEVRALASITLVDKLEEAIETVYAKARKLCVFSPGAPSYNRFANFAERGQAFSRIIRELA